MLVSTGTAIADEPTCVITPHGLLSWWPGDGNADDIMDGYHGTLVNGATFAPGKVGKSFSLDGVDDYINLPTESFDSLEYSSNVALTVWVKANELGRSEYIYQATTSSHERLALLKYGYNDRWACWSYMPGQQPILLMGPVAEPGKWIHLSVTYNNQRLKLYVNGEFYGESGEISAELGDVTHVRIGTSWNGQFSFNGLIDEVAIFNRTLSPKEIQSIYYAGGAGMCKPAGTQVLLEDFLTDTIPVRPPDTVPGYSWYFGSGGNFNPPNVCWTTQINDGMFNVETDGRFWGTISYYHPIILEYPATEITIEVRARGQGYAYGKKVSAGWGVGLYEIGNPYPSTPIVYTGNGCCTPSDTDFNVKVSTITLSEPIRDFILGLNFRDSWGWTSGYLGECNFDIDYIKISYTPSNRSPVASLVVDPYPSTESFPVDLIASASSDPDPGDVLQYRWDLDGDGNWDTPYSNNPIYDGYKKCDDYTGTVGVEVTDGELTSTAVVAVTFENLDPIIDVLEADAMIIPVGGTVNFHGVVKDPGCDYLDLEWDFDDGNFAYADFLAPGHSYTYNT